MAWKYPTPTETLEGLKASLADRYTLERELGRGGMATVYLAQDLQQERWVALKVLHPALAASLEPRRRMLLEWSGDKRRRDNYY